MPNSASTFAADVRGFEVVRTADTGARIESNRRLLEELEAGLAIRHDPSLANLVRPSDTHEPVQGWFRYREGYTLELVAQLTHACEGLVLDPFVGFGTTTLAARLSGLESAGVDVNPLAAFVAKVKTRTYSPRIRRELRSAIDSIRRVRRGGPGAAHPSLRILPKLFHPEILEALLRFRHVISQFDSPLVKDFLFMGWLSILEDVSNVYREGNGIKYRNRLRKGTTYEEIPYAQWARGYFPNDKFAFVSAAFHTKLQQMLDDVWLLEAGPEPFIAHMRAEDLTSHVTPGSVDACVFSPPYCNSFNYIKAYKLELWMGGFIESYDSIKHLTQMGVRSRAESILDPVSQPYPPVVDTFVDLMDPARMWSRQLPDLVRGYFADMQNILRRIRELVRVGGECHIVVGNSAYSDVLVPSDLILAHIARHVGWEVSSLTVARHLTTSSQQKKALAPLKGFLRETIVHLRKDA